MSKRDTPHTLFAQAAQPVSLLEENTMLSGTDFRPSIPFIDELRVSQSLARVSETGRLSLRSALHVLRRFDNWAAVAVVVATSSAVYYLGTLMLAHWQLR
jgi:hypothetical protein